MGIYRLEHLFAPRSVALVGGSPRDRSVGRSVLANLQSAGFSGPVGLVNPRYSSIEGVAAVKSISELPYVPDLLVVATPPATIPELLQAAGQQGCAAAIVLTAGLGHGHGSIAQAAEKAARAHGVRIVGPNCLGVQVPVSKLNASFAASFPMSGDLALISQSGAIAAGLVDWAAPRAVGFSAVVSIGDQLDVDIGDLLDYFAIDRGTRAILLYVEAIKNARKFMSAARAAARVKPVVVIKAGRHARGAAAARTHTGALAGADDVYDAAFRRAGLLRVFDLEELFAAAETLGRVKRVAGKRLGILTNGGGIGVLAVDRLMDIGGELATLGPAILEKLDAVLPPIWSRANPVDIAGDADAARYAAAMEALLSDDANDAILVLNVSTALASSLDAAKAVATVVHRRNEVTSPAKPVFAAWIADRGQAAREMIAAGIPHYPSEADAVNGFGHLFRYREAIDALMETPPSLPQDFTPDIAAARDIIARALAAGRSWLDPVEVSSLLKAYAIPIAATIPADGPDAAAKAAESIFAGNQRVAVKIHSPDIVHKSDVDGVRLNLADVAAVRKATAEMLDHVRATKPDARIHGVTVHPMVVRPRARELIAGIADDPTFGPIVVFGAGGTSVEVVDDKALTLPPVDLKLAYELIARTRMSRVLGAYRNVPAANTADLALVLVKLAQLAADIPEIREVDLNPLLNDHDGVMAVDARVAIAPLDDKARRVPGHPRFAIRPYPKEWERHRQAPDGTAIFIRPIRPEDERLYGPFLARVEPNDMRLRFFTLIKEFSRTLIARMTQLDYARAMAFAAIEPATGDLLGVVRLHANADYDKAEYAVLVRSDVKGRGVGWVLMETILEYARSEGLLRIEAQVLNENTTMLKMCRELGFSMVPDAEEPGSCLVRLDLEPAAKAEKKRPQQG